MLHFGFPLFLALSALLGGEHVDIAGHERYLLAPALGARRFQGFVLGDGFGALKLLSAFLATILVGRHGLTPATRALAWHYFTADRCSGEVPPRSAFLAVGVFLLGRPRLAQTPPMRACDACFVRC